LFPRAFAWTDRKDTAWFGIVMAALLPSALMLWSYTTATGLTGAHRPDRRTHREPAIRARTGQERVTRIRSRRP
jgi:hypothetical protein